MLFRKKISTGKDAKFSKFLNLLQLEPPSPKTSNISTVEEYNTSKQMPKSTSAISGSKDVQLINELQKVEGQVIKPFVDFNEGKLFYPFLSYIRLRQDDVDFLDSLVSKGILEKKIFEKLVVCPVHTNTYSSSVHLYCPNCHSIDIEKLNLFEHKRCGYISDGKNFDFSNPINSECPSCKKPIKNFDREIRVPAMWFQCNKCEEKFDNVDVKLRCRKYEHDFDTNSAQFVPTYCYALKNSEHSVDSKDIKIIQEIAELLSGFNFDSDVASSIVGKSGNPHKIPILGIHKLTGEKIIIFVLLNDFVLEEASINSILIPVLDIEPKYTLFVTNSDVSDPINAIAQRYNISIISHNELSNLVSCVESFFSDLFSKGVNNEK